MTLVNNSIGFREFSTGLTTVYRYRQHFVSRLLKSACCISEPEGTDVVDVCIIWSKVHQSAFFKCHPTIRRKKATPLFCLLLRPRCKHNNLREGAFLHCN